MVSNQNQKLIIDKMPHNKSADQHWTEGWKQMEKTYYAELKTREKHLIHLDEESDNLKKEVSLVEMELDQIEAQRVSLYDVCDVLDHEVDTHDSGQSAK